MNKQIAKMLTTEYEKRQTVSLNNYLNSKSALYSKIPEIEDIDFSIKKIGLNLNRSIVLGKEEEKSKFLDHMTRLKEEKNKF